MKTFKMCGLGLWLLGAGSAFAGSDGVVSVGQLSDADLYRLMTCGAAPGGACQGPIVRWNKPTVSVAFVDDTQGISPEKTALIEQSVTQAMATLNAASANLQLVRVDKAADVTLYHVAMKAGDVTLGTPGMPDGLTIGVGHMWVTWDDDLHIQSANILITSDIGEDEVRSVVLEELTQSLGFPYDIENPFYEGVSILSQDSNETISITGQDRAMLRMHYPFE